VSNASATIASLASATIASLASATPYQFGANSERTTVSLALCEVEQRHSTLHSTLNGRKFLPTKDRW
jgi:hypothetical protein